MQRARLTLGLFLLLTGLPVIGGAADAYQAEASYTGLRNMLLTTSPDKLGLDPSPTEVWGVLMETGYPEAVVSLVALADGTASLYFSHGGGLIGFGQHPGPQRAAKSLLSVAQLYARHGKPVQAYPLPKPAFTRFYLRVGDRVVSVEVKEDDLGYGRHPLSPLFHKGQELIAEMRAVEQTLRAAKTDPPR